ncbi:MAG: SusC/RagA family TonB-linked outer membrane protein [Flavobacteriaceae bacterium]
MKNKLLTKLLFLPLFFLMGGYAFAQITVGGNVSDANGPVPGVNVIVKGTSNGAQTDFDGNYSLNDVATDAVLVYSYIGYVTQEVAVGGRTSINVTLQEDIESLAEVVVIGYGTTTVKDATGAVTAVTSEDFNQGVISSPEQLIQGKTAGVQITQTSGEPGAGISFRIRGSNSIRSNNNPLFVIDGVPLSGESTTPSGGDVVNGGNATRNPLNFINPNDIESISILKDASATAIYGSRGANGVVIITTKSGKSSKKPTWEFSSNLSISTPAKYYDLYDAKKFLAATAELRSEEIANENNYRRNTDWQKYIFRTSASQNQNLSYSQNFGDGNVRATFGYGKQFGVIEKSDQERITGRVNAGYRFFQNKLKLNLQTSISRVNDQAPPVSGRSGASGNLIGAAYAANPTWPADPGFFLEGNQINPANYLENFQAITKTNRFLGNFSAEYNFTPEFSGKVAVGYDKSDANAFTTVTPDLNNFERVSGNGQASYNNLEVESKLLEGTLNYKKDFENFTIDFLVGYSFQDFNRKGFNSMAWGTNYDLLDEISSSLENSVDNLLETVQGPYQQFGYDRDKTFVNSIIPFDDTIELSSNFQREFRALWVDTFDNTDELQSYFARANFSFNGKYLLTATMRADGSSRFGTSNQYGYFPSGAFAWQIDEENFVGDAVSTLKLRLGAGLTGNQEGLGYANYLLRSRFQAPNISNDGLIPRPALETVAVQNPELKWESTLDLNVGLDFGFNDDRFSGSIDVYKKETKDLLFRQAAAAPAFDPFVFKNLENGKVVNQGVELALNYDFIDSDDVTLSTSFNISYNKNTVEELNGTTADFGELNGPGLTGAFAQKLGEGESLFSYYLAEYSEDAEGNPDFNPDDKKFVGKDGLPDINTGLSINLKVKNFDLSTYFAGQFGFYVYNNTANAFLNRNSFLSTNNTTDEALELKSQEVSTLYLEKGDFIRLQSATLGYNWPVKGDSFFDSIRLSVTGQNLFLITDYSGLDPEISSDTGDFGSGIPSAGIDYLSFPRPRTITFGFNARF